jgi:hypothetical protein
MDNRYDTREHPCPKNGEVPIKIEKLGRRRSIPGMYQRYRGYRNGAHTRIVNDKVVS